MNNHYYHYYYDYYCLAASLNESQTPETGARGKESGLFKCQQSEKMGNSCLKAHLFISVVAEDFIPRERENRAKRSRGMG